MLKELVPVDNYKETVTGLFYYLFGKYDLKKYLRIVPNRKDGVKAKDAAKINGYISKNCKLFAYAHHVAVRDETKKPKYADFGITQEDARLLRKLDLSFMPKRKKFEASSLKAFDAKLNLILPEGNYEMSQYVGKLISKKMMFLIKNFDIPRKDIETALKQAALMAVYKKFPRFDSDLHFINIAKAAIHNTAMSFISFHTTKSRQRLKRNADGSFESVHVDLQSLSSLEAPTEYGSHLRDSLHSLVQLTPKFKPKARQVILCLAGKHHAGFSEFLQRDNTEVVNDIGYDQYILRVKEHFGISDRKMANLFKYLREHV